MEQVDRTGLQHLRARYYDPANSRFLSRDPQSLNRYSYVLNNQRRIMLPQLEVATAARLQLRRLVAR